MVAIYIQYTEILSEQKVLQVLTLMEPTRENLIPDPLAVLCLNNQLYMFFNSVG